MGSAAFFLVAAASIAAISSTPQGYYPQYQAQFGPGPAQNQQPFYYPAQPYPYQQQQPGSNRGGREFGGPQEPSASNQVPALFNLAAPAAPAPLTENDVPGSASSSLGAKKYNKKYPLTAPVLKFRIGVISDLDKAATLKKEGKNEPSGKWHALLNEADLYVLENKEEPSKSNVTVEWDENKIHEVKSGLAYSGRGMELSTLNVFNGHLYSCDDKTGVVYELPINEDELDITPIPWTILADGNFTGPNGFKCEWATIKENDLWVGGHGTSFEKPDGTVVRNNKFVKVITPAGEVTHLDWSKNFDKMAEVLDIHFPGYVTHEAAGWSDVLKKWIFMPRKINKNKFEDADDETKGNNVILLADEDFGNVQVGHIGDLIPTHGFASFKFVPGTGDQMILAIKSVEADGKTESFIMAFDLRGNILLPETKFSDLKYEGVEFI